MQITYRPTSKQPSTTRQTGSGTYVAEPRQRVRMVRSSAREQPDGSPFRADMRAVGRQGDWESRTDAKVPAPAEFAARLGVSEGDLCVQATYKFLADGRPVQLSTRRQSQEDKQVSKGAAPDPPSAF